MDVSDQTRMIISKEILPATFQNEITKDDDIVTIRSNIKTISEINEWVKEFGLRTNTKWNFRTSCPSGKKLVCSKKFTCHHSSFRKVPVGKGKSKNAECRAYILVKIKLNTKNTRSTDKLVKKGLVGVILVNPYHRHSLISAEILRHLPAEECRLTFEGYFNEGMGPTKAARYHKQILESKADFQPIMLVNSRINPTLRTIQNWYEKWKMHQLQNRQGTTKDIKKEKYNVEAAYQGNPFDVAVNDVDLCKSFPPDEPKKKIKIECLDFEIESPSEDYSYSYLLDELQIPIVDRSKESFSENPSSELLLPTARNPSANSSSKNRKKELSEELIELFATCLEKFDVSEQALEKSVERLKNVTAEEQWETLIATLGSNIQLE